MIAELLAATLGLSTPQAVRPRPVLPQAASPAFRTRSEARPALWVVNDHDTIIYLFGTFHALDGNSQWFKGGVMNAFTQSDELILETLAPKAPPPSAAAASMAPIAGSESFLASSRMVMSAGRTRGMSTARGADAILRNAAESIGKPVGSLESFAAQLNIFGSMKMPAPAPSANSAQSSANGAAMAAVLASLQDAWNRGDIEHFAPMLERMRSQSPENYKLMFLDRNARWAGWIARRLEQPGTVFVAVGAGHLAGRDSVQHKLAQAGIRSARIG